MIGENFVKLVGKVVYPNFKEFSGTNKLLKGKIAIPIDGGMQYIKFSAWNSLAEDIFSLKANTFIKIHGHIEERSYSGNCRYCGGSDKKFWTEVVIDNFVILKGE